MAQPSTLYRFRIDLSDVDRGVYAPLDFRLAMHPSESYLYLLTRALAYALSYDEDLELSPAGLADPEAPAMKVTQPGSGRISLWVEVGNPSPKKLHKAAKAAASVRVYTYKDPTLIQRECQGESIHRAESIEVYGIDPKFLERVSESLQREVKWSLLQHDSSLTLSWGEHVESSEIKKYSLVPTIP